MQRFLYESNCGMTTIHYKGIAWSVNGVKDGKGVLTYHDCSIVWNQAMGAYQFMQGGEMHLTRELRSDCVKDATDCILEAYASQFVPSWESNGTAQASP